MPSTRSSARQGDNPASSSPPSAKSSAGTKRKADEATSPSNKAKRGRPSKDQKTLEEAISTAPKDDAAKHEELSKAKTDDDAEDTNDGSGVNGNSDEAKQSDEQTGNGVSMEDKEKKPGTPRDEPDLTTSSQAKADGENGEEDSKTDKKHGKGQPSEETKNGDTNGSAQEHAIEDDKKREAAMPSNILEKGIIYFFSRGRVGVDDPDSVQDLARSYFVMRPLPAGAKLTDGAIQDLQNNRLIALPKKVWPKSGKDKFMVFVEKGKTSISTLKEEFFSGSEYSTKTTGVRQTPEVSPLGEGVYAITSTGSGRPTTHLVYMLTVPAKLGEVQTDVGLAEKGSFVLSLKNPESSGPAYAQLPEKPDFPKEFIEEFSGRGWLPAHPKHLDYPNAQVLLIGEDFDSSSNLDPTSKDEKSDEKETPQEELEKLESEDEHRVHNLRGDDSIFADLEISSRDYPKIMTTW